jgi:large subunit ribosomal protein L9
MKILLCEDIKKLGWLGDIVEVKEGFARNFLLPQGLAKVATENNVRALAQKKAARAEERMKERRRLEAAAQAVEGAEAVIAAKANEQGVLFGSISEAVIAANLRDQGFAVADEIVKLHEHLKEVGTHSVTLKFDDDLKATVKVTVVAEKAEGEAAEQAPKAEGSDEDADEAAAEDEEQA